MTDRTHWSDCWRDPAHHDCAVARIAELEAALAASEKDAARWQDRAEKAGTAVALFARAIKFGENWSPMCEAMLTQVNSAGSDAAIAKERL